MPTFSKINFISFALGADAISQTTIQPSHLYAHNRPSFMLITVTYSSWCFWWKKNTIAIGASTQFLVPLISKCLVC
jgi:hypothetical protein